MSWCFNGGIGDKIYSLPALYAYEGQVGIPSMDEPIYRLVKSKVRFIEPGDKEAFLGIGNHQSELVDQIAEKLGVSDKMTLKMPIMETTEEEKKAMTDEGDYIVLALWATAPNRCWSEGLALRDRFDCPVKVVFKRDLGLLPMIERARCVISVDTSVIPIAGALQVPIVAIDAPNRTGYFLDVEQARKNERSVLEAYERLMSKPRPVCRCGKEEATRSIRDNTYVLTCACGAERQKTRFSTEAIDRYCELGYHALKPLKGERLEAINGG